jgi:hypothetical protein
MQYTLAPLVLFATVSVTLGGAAHLYLGGADGETTGRVATALGAEGPAIAANRPDEGADDVGFDPSALEDMLPGFSAETALSMVPGLPGIPTMKKRGKNPFGELPVSSRERRDRDRDVAPGDRPRDRGPEDRGPDDRPDTRCRGSSCGRDDKQCFAADTLITTASGPIAIQALEPGDLILTRAAADQPLVERAVTAVYETEDAPILEITIGEDGGASELLEVTAGHPFWVEPGGWVDSDALAPGDQLLTADGDAARVLSVASTDRRETVYNLTVDEHHTYFVGATASWVHNAGGCDDDDGKRKRDDDVDAGPSKRPKDDKAEKERREKEAIDRATENIMRDTSAANINKQLHDLIPPPGKLDPSGKPTRAQKGSTTATLTATVDGNKVTVIGTSSDCLNSRQSQVIKNIKDQGVNVIVTPGMPQGMAANDNNPSRPGEKIKDRASRCNNPNTGSDKNPHHAEMRAIHALCKTLSAKPENQNKNVCDMIDEIACDKPACVNCSASLNQMSLLDKYSAEHPLKDGSSARPDGSDPGHMTVAQCARTKL